jgi:hypothetical protein
MEKLKMSKEGKGAAAARKRQAEVPDAALLTKYQASLAQFRQRKRDKGDAESATLARLKGFTARLKEQRRGGSNAESGAGALPGMAAYADAGEEAPDGGGAGAEAARGYNGEVNKAIDHRSYLPAAWRVRISSKAPFESLHVWRHDANTARLPCLCTHQSAPAS